MSLFIGHLDLAMSILETLNNTIGNIIYGLKNSFGWPYLAEVVYFAVTTTQSALKFKVLVNWNLAMSIWNI